MRTPNILYILLVYLTGADALRVTMSRPRTEALREEDVTIPCDISDVRAGGKIAVQWTRKWNQIITTVYPNIPGSVHSYRAGSYVVESELEKGNAELHIPSVQFSDEGEYNCSAFVTPDKVTGTSVLQVSARPSASLTPRDISVLLGTERTVMCAATNFYPQPVTIRWFRHNKGSPGCVALDRGICTADPVTNGDDTFNVTSHLTLHPTSMDDDGNEYSCTVSHRSLQMDLGNNFTLTVTEQEDNIGAVVGAVIGTLISTLLLVSGIFLYWKLFEKDPPILSEISGNEQMIDMARTTLTCQITGFRPNDIKISVRLRRGETRMDIHTWKSRDHIPPARMTRDDSTGGDRVVIDVEEQQGLVNGAANHQERPLQLELVPVIKTSRLGTSSCQCSIHITPSFADNGAELSVHVEHPALRSPISVQRTLNVIGVAPKLLTIMSPERLIHDEPVTLTCPINGYKPRALSITWLRKDQSQETELVTRDGTGTRILDNRYSHTAQEIEHDDKSYSCISALRIKPNLTEDHGVKYICRTHHPATGQTAEQILDMEVTARPVLDTIQRTQNSLSVGDQMDLSCRIHSFSPSQITVTWYMEDENVIPSHTSNVLTEPNGLFYVTSTMEFHPTIKDAGKRFRCEVLHDSLVEPRYITYTLCGLMSAPSVSEITCDPVYPEIGKPVTLSCTVSDLYPKEYGVRWYMSGSVFTSGERKENIQQDQESGIFSGTLELTLTPTTEHHGAEFRLDFIREHKTVKKTFVMNLKGNPILRKITSDPNKASYGKPLTLRCSVTGCKRGDITVDWLEDNKTLGRHRRTAAQVSVEVDTIHCTLTITPTAEDYRRIFMCSVKQKDTPTAFSEKICLTLPDIPPSLSTIVVHPAMPKAGKDVSLTTTISGFSPKDIIVRWYKGFSTFPNSAETSSDLRIGEDSLYTCSSTLRFTPEQSDHNTSIRCEVTHAVTKTVRQIHYDLCLTGVPDPVVGSRHSSQRPRAERKPFTIRGIECLTDSPRVGDDVTLRCNVDGCNADDCEFSWYNGAYPIEGNTENGDLEDGSGSFSTVTFTAEKSDRSCTVRYTHVPSISTILF
ncbi:uncharacterized protein LOC134968589 isoform X2 [Pseudophryne corroboree]|uniref:uncharacterized protein LOC134968589 isoform X2 n=1 Tax=Pseudophryne corroboree TaxID=495146 RepID=UPI003081501C